VLYNSVVDADLTIMINGLPGLMAAETAKVCLDRGFKLIPIGFTGKNPPEYTYNVIGSNGKSQLLQLIEGPGVNNRASATLSSIKSSYPNCILIDYTHPSAVLSNIACYVENSCDFVMGTTGVDASAMKKEFESGTNYAVIAPNMAKQIVALQYALDQMSNRFPNSYTNYKLKVPKPL